MLKIKLIFFPLSLFVVFITVSLGKSRESWRAMKTFPPPEHIVQTTMLNNSYPAEIPQAVNSGSFV